jgi:hypothetical protein
VTPIDWDPAARAEFDEALARSSDTPAFLADVDATLAALASGLLSAARVPRTPCRECVMTRLPYRIVYMDPPALIRIVAFAHTSRRLGYWKSRLHRP